MSKMGNELEKRLDENKYLMYEALKELIRRDDYGSIRLPTQARDIITKVLSKIEKGGE